MKIQGHGSIAESARPCDWIRGGGSAPPTTPLHQLRPAPQPRSGGCCSKTAAKSTWSFAERLRTAIHFGHNRRLQRAGGRCKEELQALTRSVRRLASRLMTDGTFTSQESLGLLLRQLLTV